VNQGRRRGRRRFVLLQTCQPALQVLHFAFQLSQARVDIGPVRLIAAFELGIELVNPFRERRETRIVVAPGTTICPIENAQQCG